MPTPLHSSISAMRPGPFESPGSVCHDVSRAEEAVQDGFLLMWRNRTRYRSELGSFQTWSMKIVQNRAIDFTRRHTGRRQELVGALPQQVPKRVSASAEDEVIGRSESDELRAALQRLPDAQARVVGLAFFGGLSHSEIAAQLRLPKGTVKGRMRLGLEKLRTQLAPPH